MYRLLQADGIFFSIFYIVYVYFAKKSADIIRGQSENSINFK